MDRADGKLRVLIGGERFGRIRDSFLSLGHDAMSCDFSDTVRPGPHYVGNWWDIINDGWDLAIFHPTCTNMANSGALNLFNNRKKNGGLNEDRWIALGRDAWEFWNLLNNCKIKHFCIENPIMLGYAQIMIGQKPTQTIQPYDFGADASKATCLWLNNLPNLQPTKRIPGRLVYHNGKMVERWANQTDSGQNREPPTTDPEIRRMRRSEFFPGVADAMADQWSRFVIASISDKKEGLD
jgi:hypothetical protein